MTRWLLGRDALHGFRPMSLKGAEWSDWCKNDQKCIWDQSSITLEIALSQAKPTPCFRGYESMESIFAILAQSSNIINLNETCFDMCTAVYGCCFFASWCSDELPLLCNHWDLLYWDGLVSFWYFQGFMGFLKLGSPKPWVSNGFNAKMLKVSNFKDHLGYLHLYIYIYTYIYICPIPIKPIMFGHRTTQRRANERANHM